MPYLASDGARLGVSPPPTAHRRPYRSVGARFATDRARGLAALAARRGDALDEVALAEEEDDDDRQGDEHRRRHHELDLAFAAVDAELVDQQLQATRKCEQIDIADVDEGPQEVGPARLQL